MNNHRFWGNHFQRDFIPNLRLLVDVLVERLLPVFDGIEKEADAKSEEAWNRYMRESGDPDDDPSTFAEWAHEVGQSHYNAMVRMRQTLLNSHAVTMYHAWEQQLLSFHRRELLHPGDENDNSLMNMKVIRKRLASEGVEVSDFASWGKIDEMRL